MQNNWEKLNDNKPRSEQIRYCQKIVKLRDAFYSEDDMTASYNQMIEKAQSLKTKYPDYEDYAAYHALIGSTAPEATQLDFPNNDSIKKWLEEKTNVVNE